MTNIHSPERREGESMQAYSERRAQSMREVRRVLRPVAGQNRRHHIKAAGGIRQLKRAQYVANFPEYAQKHPQIAAHFA